MNFILIGCPFQNRVGELEELLFSSITAEVSLHEVLSTMAHLHHLSDLW